MTDDSNYSNDPLHRVSYKLGRLQASADAVLRAYEHVNKARIPEYLAEAIEGLRAERERTK